MVQWSLRHSRTHLTWQQTWQWRCRWLSWRHLPFHPKKNSLCFKNLPFWNWSMFLSSFCPTCQRIVTLKVLCVYQKINRPRAPQLSAGHQLYSSPCHRPEKCQVPEPLGQRKDRKRIPSRWRSGHEMCFTKVSRSLPTFRPVIKNPTSGYWTVYSRWKFTGTALLRVSGPSLDKSFVINFQECWTGRVWIRMK